MSEESSELFSDGDVCWLVLLWTVFWFVVTIFLGGLCCRTGGHRLVDVLLCGPPTPLERNLRRLRRSMLYCLLAGLAAVRLLYRSHKRPEELLHEISWEHQVFFSMAIAHRLLALREDRQSKRFIAGGLGVASLPGIYNPADAILLLYTAQNLMLAMGFAAMLACRRCGAIGAFALLTDVPTLLLSQRERDVTLLKSGSRSPLRWLHQPRGVVLHWMRFGGCLVVARVGPVALYLYSLWSARDELQTLTREEAFIYHGVPSSIIGFSWVASFLWKAWMSHDITVARELAKADPAAPLNGCQPNRAISISDGFEVNGAALPPEPMAAERLLKSITPAEFARMTTGDAPKLWLEIDGLVYDVEHFLREHPGGELVLRQWVGKDATEAFGSVKHSVTAKDMMYKFVVGFVDRPPSEYRLFEHRREAWDLSRPLMYQALSALVAMCVVSRVLGSWWDTRAPLASTTLLSLLSLVVVGCMVSLVNCSTSLFQAGFACHAGALSVVVFHVILTWVVIGDMGAAVAEVSAARSGGMLPGGLELGGFATLLCEASRHGAATRCAASVKDGKRSGCCMEYLFGGFTGAPGSKALVVVLLSVVMRLLTASAGDELANGHGTSLSLALLLGLAASAMTRCLDAGQKQAGKGDCRDTEQVLAAVCSTLRLSGIYSVLCLVALHTYSEPAQTQLADLMSSPHLFAAALGVSAVSCMAHVLLIASTASRSSAAFTARSVAYCLIFGWMLSCPGVFSGYRWVDAAAFFQHLSAMGRANRERLRRASKDGSFSNLPTHLVGMQASWDYVLVALGTFVWKLLILPLQSIHTFLLPSEFQFYAYETPIFDLGSGVELGVAAHFAPKGSASTGTKLPNHFVCNVGQIATIAPSLSDVQRTQNTLRDVWDEFKQPWVKGLMSNMVFVFPYVQQQGVLKEVNLSAWEDMEAAHDWYVKSPGHRDILCQHTSGTLQTFGNMLASLKPGNLLKHQDRCRHCARAVEAPRPGMPAPHTCGACGGPTFRYPIF